MEQVKTNPLKCIYGNTVKLQNTKTRVVELYALVPPNQERLDKKHISNYTDVGQAIWGKMENDVVEIELPGKGKELFKILGVTSTEVGGRQ
ncbi:MAG TPA: GreA/GreB family elongation factor [bacterium]|nr:GreA/GreB family elongation factor [bacterium]